MVRTPPAGARNRRKKTPPRLIFNNPRSSIEPGSAPDPIKLLFLRIWVLYLWEKLYGVKGRRRSCRFLRIFTHTEEGLF